MPQVHRGRSSRFCGFSSFITHHGSVGLINGLIAATIGALRMLMSELTAKSNVKRTSMFVLSLASYTNSERSQNGITDLCKQLQ